MLAIIETAMTFFAQQAMETAVQNAGRLIRTGQAQEQGLNATTFKAKICNQIQIMFACTSQLAIDVRGYSTFDSISYTPPINDDGELDIDDFVYEPGSGGEIIVLRAYYEWPVLINVFGMNDYSNLSNGKHLITSTAAFKNEPFPW
jgi:Flp pilus assembly protein TadG